MVFRFMTSKASSKGQVSVFPDPEYFGAEERFIGIGETDQRRSVFLVFTLRRKDEAVLIRPISARYMHKKEIDHYEQETSKTQKRRGG